MLSYDNKILAFSKSLLYNLPHSNMTMLMLYYCSWLTRRNQVRKKLSSFLKILNLAGMVMLFQDWMRKMMKRLSLGITPRHRAEEVKRLHYTDYFRGPSPDYDGIAGKEWWEFGLRVKGHEIYIKIRIYKRERGSYGGKCMSFHIAEEKITYPFKEKRDENHD